jgi:hypothetical protein
MVTRIDSNPPLGPLGSIAPLSRRRREERGHGGQPDPRSQVPPDSEAPADSATPPEEAESGAPCATRNPAAEPVGRRHIDVRV